MDLNTLWFILITVLFIGFFVLEGFDYGVGVLMPILGRTDDERRAVLNTIGPHWDGNEVWALTAGGAIFAAFPMWYATMFSGFYLALVVLLLALIARGVAIEYRSKDRRPGWRRMWDALIFIGSLVPAVLWGVALSNLARGVPIDGRMQFTGTFWDLVSPYSLLAGVATLVVFLLHGSIFLALKAREDMADRAKVVASRLWPVVVIIVVAFVLYSYVETDVFIRLGVNPGGAAIGAAAALLSVGWFIRVKAFGWAFAAAMATVGLSLVTIFSGLYPRVMISSTEAAYSLTIYNAASTPYTLSIMSAIALTLVPVVLLYQGWSYWVFRNRLRREDPHVY
jgi:cytochrome d ubiquinol oxidase subunit II